METDIAIIGGGLSGLATAAQLDQSGLDWQLVEARDRFGGRILSSSVDLGPDATARYDLGPAWIWPHNPLVLELTKSLGLTVFPQHATGRLVFQDTTGRVQRDLEFAPMAGFYRIAGGMSALTDGLADLLPHERLQRNAKVTHIRAEGSSLCVSGPNWELMARKVILALPPRLAARINYSPNLPAQAHTEMAGIPTWMAGQAKAVAVYKHPFWRDQGLSGDGISHKGPLVEIHDASPATGGQGALFGFIGTPARDRRADPSGLHSAILTQLADMFGPSAADPEALLLHDWAEEAETATLDDHAPLGHHPAYGLPKALEGLMENRLIFAGSEVAPGQGGFIEGALEAAGAAARQITKTAMPVPS
ncbi:MAG: FAD-dependent oxidoreductase [Pseudomonadota bacterium]